MKLVTFAGLALAVSVLPACSYLPFARKSSEAPLSVELNFLRTDGVEIKDARYPSVADMHFPAGDGKPYTVNFPVNFSAQCDSTKTKCSHDVVNAELTVASEKVDARTLRLMTEFRARSGRASNLVFAQDAGSKNQVARIQPATPSAAGEGAELNRLNAQLQRGDYLEIDGANDVRVRITIR